MVLYRGPALTPQRLTDHQAQSRTTELRVWFDAVDAAVRHDIDVILAASDEYLLPPKTRRLVDTVLSRGSQPLVVAPTRVTLPRDDADDLLTDGPEDQNEQDDQDAEDDLPDGTLWVDDQPAPAAGQEHTGRPPLGYTTSDGTLYPTDQYADVRYYLVAIEDGRIAVTSAAKEMDANETTVKRILHDPERRERYALDVRVDADQ